MEQVRLGKWKKVKGKEVFVARLTALHKEKLEIVEISEFREDLTKEALNVVRDIRSALEVMGRLCK